MEHHRLLQHDIASEGVCITIVTKLVRLLLDEEIRKHTDFVDRWLKWSGEQELWKRTMDGFTEVMGDESPVLLHIEEDNDTWIK